jgi:ribulose kinase
MNKLKKIIFVSVFLLACLSLNAQKNLSIDNLFRDYGKQKGSILIELAKDVLGGHTKIVRYRSLITPADSALAGATLNAIREDLKDGTIMMESVKDGKIETGYYCLKKEDDAQDYEYILFTNKLKKMTLIYIKGHFPPSQLENELDTLKNLFIKVNNKQIKLQ